MSPTRQDAEWRELTGPTYAELGHRDTIDWHYHDVHQIVYPSSGVLAISAAAGTWVVPPQRAVWIPVGVPHAHQAHGPVQMRTLAISSAVPAPPDQPLPSSPAVLDVSPLLREVIVALTSGDGTPYTARQRATMEQVALDQLRRVGQLPVGLPTLADDRLRAIVALLRADPADERTLASLGVAVGASERTLSPAVPAAGGDDVPAVAHPVPAAARAGAAGRPNAGDDYRAGLRLVEPERVYRDVQAGVRRHSWQVLRLGGGAMSFGYSQLRNLLRN